MSTATTAVVAKRNIPREGPDYFATPPWATRALLHRLVYQTSLLSPAHDLIAEPACGGGHMVGVLRDAGFSVEPSDKHDYGWGHRVADFLTPAFTGLPDWIITNPPFNKAAEFVERGLDVSRYGLALLVRTSFLEGETRWRRLFTAPGTRGLRPRMVLQFASRVTMRPGGWFPDASRRGQTSYAWVVWVRGGSASNDTLLDWFPADARTVFTRADDVARFAGAVAPCMG